MDLALLSGYILLVINALMTALFIYAATEAWRLAKPDFDGVTEFKPPWAEKVTRSVTVLLLLLLVAIALTLAYRYYYRA